MSENGELNVPLVVALASMQRKHKSSEVT